MEIRVHSPEGTSIDVSVSDGNHANNNNLRFTSRQSQYATEWYYPKLPKLPPIEAKSSDETVANAIHCRLRDLAIKHPESPNNIGFWPPKLFDHLFGQHTVERIVIELVEGRSLKVMSGSTDSKAVKSWTDKICGKDGHEFRRILAILVLMEQETDISSFIDADVTDDTLPLVKERLEMISARIRGWKKMCTDTFCIYQHGFTVPILSAKTCLSQSPYTGGNELPHYELEEDTLKPWIKLSEKPETSSAFLDPKVRASISATFNNAEISMGGGYGDVYKIRMHPWLHDFRQSVQKLSASTNEFALKRLKLDGNPKEVFEKETQMLKRFGGQHPHIVTLLATIICKHEADVDEYHLLFPWAEGDLLTFWKRGDFKHTHQNLMWAAEQFHGIVEAVTFIHNPPQKDSNGEKLYGRHGDIKPENILWFKPNGTEILVLSDLGIAAVHRLISRSEQPPKMPVTFNYKPPEYDMDGHQGHISRSYDIWTLGCIFLEFIVWALEGWDGRVSFNSGLMSTPYINGVGINMFYTVQRLKDSSKYVFNINEEVTRTFARLHGHNKCTEYIHSFLDLIQRHMLIVESYNPPIRRMRGEELLKSLEQLRTRCKDDGDYCMTPSPRVWPHKPLLPVQAKLNEGAQQWVTGNKNAKKLNLFAGLETRTAKPPKSSHDGGQYLAVH